MNKKKNIIIYSAFAVLLAVFTFTDLKIAEHMYQPGNLFGKIFQILGEFPVYLGIILFGVTLINIAPKLFKILGYAANFVGSVLLIIMPARHLMHLGIISIIVCVACGVVIGFDILFLSKLVKKETYKIILPVSVLWLICAAGGPGICAILKTIFGRVRFVNLDGTYSNYTRWYHINGFNGNRSFPSGHTASAGSLLALVAAPLLIEMKGSKKLLIRVVCISFIVLTALSRMVLGMHFASDVLCGFIIAYTVREVALRIILKHRQRHIN